MSQSFSEFDRFKILFWAHVYNPCLVSEVAVLSGVKDETLVFEIIEPFVKELNEDKYQLWLDPLQHALLAMLKDQTVLSGIDNERFIEESLSCFTENILSITPELVHLLETASLIAHIAKRSITGNGRQRLEFMIRIISQKLSKIKVLEEGVEIRKAIRISELPEEDRIYLASFLH